ncbi:hypothetical protein SAMN02910356_02360 [Selenomonas sp. GACV-9]|nr:hypothetical protein SAMN02910356_02360 [Selenomonas ruminantium]
MMKMLKKADILLIVLLLLLSLLPLRAGTNKKPAAVYADISVGGQLSRRVVLSAHQGRETFTLQTPDGHYNTIEIDDDTIAVIDADCPDKLCIQQGKARKAGDIIACLPHKLIIEVKGSAADDTEDIIPAR